MAVPTELLDSYVKDVLSSFALFWVIIIPVFWKAYISKDGFAERNPNDLEDTYASMLKQAFERKEKQNQFKAQKAAEESDGKIVP